jgi:hypothetical protein
MLAKLELFARQLSHIVQLLSQRFASPVKRPTTQQPLRIKGLSADR